MTNQFYAILAFFASAIMHVVAAEFNDSAFKVVNGYNIDIEFVPYTVFILSRTEGTVEVCAGAIISKRIILTAAHCFSSNPHLVHMISNSTDLSKGYVIQAKKLIIHPNFTSSKTTLKNDIAVIFTKEDIPKAEIIPLADHETLPSEFGLATGWGRTDPDKPVAFEPLRGIVLKVVSIKKCSKMYKEKNFIVTNGMLCAESTTPGGVCKGDSGGPFVIDNQLVGITSLGVHTCGLEKKLMPTIFTSVYKYRGWIKNVTGI